MDGREGRRAKGKYREETRKEYDSEEGKKRGTNHTLTHREEDLE